MHVPSIADLTALFGSTPISIAEIGGNRYLPLSEWPKGELVATCAVAGRTLQMRINPTPGEVAIDVDAPDRIASVTLANVVAIGAIVRDHGTASALVRCADGASATIRLRPPTCRSLSRTAPPEAEPTRRSARPVGPQRPP